MSDQPCAWYGGTFDPVHTGHIHAARTVCAELELATVQMVLSARPPHRRAPFASVEARWQMLCLACAEYPQLVANPLEMHRDAPSYTVDTVAGLGRQTPAGVVNWIVGSDSFATLTQWHRWREIPDLCNLIVLSRPGQQAVYNQSVTALLQAHGVEQLNSDHNGQIVQLAAPMLQVSATDIRQQIAATAVQPGDAGNAIGTWHDLLPAPVSAYITQHQLYIDHVAAGR